MDKQKTFARNLEAIRRIHGQSLAEFAKAADIPKSTLQSIRLNDALGLPLDSLVGDDHMPEKVDLIQHILKSIDWFQTLSADDQEEVLLHFRKILEKAGK